MDSKEEKIVIAVDLDEVVFTYLKDYREDAKLQGLNHPEEDPSVFSMVEAGWFSSDDEYRKSHGISVEGGLYERLNVIEGASEVLHDLRQSGYEVNIVTSRFVNNGQHAKVLTQTAIALDANKIPYSSISFLSKKTRFLADVYIDDGPHNLLPLQELDRFTITFDMNYNRHVPGARAHNWTEVREILRDKFGK